MLIVDLTADALQRHGIAASGAAGNRSSLMLVTAGTRQADGSMRLDWTLARSDGSVIAELSEAISSDAELDRATEVLAAWIEPRGGLIEKKPEPLRVAVLAVDGASSDGNDLLRRAVQRALKRARVELTNEVTPEGHAVEGTVEIERLDSGMDAVRISWIVRDATGGEVGKIDLANTVPAGSLDRTWRAVAAPIADGAVEGVVALLREVERMDDRARFEALRKTGASPGPGTGQN